MAIADDILGDELFDPASNVIMTFAFRKLGEEATREDPTALPAPAPDEVPRIEGGRL